MHNALSLVCIKSTTMERVHECLSRHQRESKTALNRSGRTSIRSLSCCQFSVRIEVFRRHTYQLRSKCKNQHYAEPGYRTVP